MASIQSKKGKAGKRTYYVVVSINSKHKWLKAGSQSDAKKLKKQIESLENSERLDKLGLSSKSIRVDDYFQKYTDYIKMHSSPNTVKRYLSVLNIFIVFLKMFHPRIKELSQIKREHIESYQIQRLQSVELKIQADGVKNGNHKSKKLPLPQTVNYELSVLRTAFIQAQDKGYISVVPTKGVKKLKPQFVKHPKILSPDECKIFLNSAKQIATIDKRLSVYYKAFKFILNTGLRSGEICNLLWSDIDLETRLLKIQEKPDWSPKTYSREFYLNDTCIKLLKSINPKEGYVFKTHFGCKLKND